MRRACLLLLLSGCFNPDDLIPIRGSFDAPGQRVELLRAPLCDDAWKLLKDTNAADDGAFQFEVFRAQVQTLSNMRAQCLRAQTTFPSGTRTASTIRALALTADLPKFVDWQPSLSLDGGALVFNALDAGEFTTTHVAELKLNDGGIAWTQKDRRLDETGTYPAPLIIDERVLHEFDATLSLVAKYGVVSNLSTEIVVTQQEVVTVHPAGSFDFAATMIPLSRGGACDELPSPCVLTDGRLDENDFLERRIELLKTFTIRFSSPATPTLLVARDLSMNSVEYLLDADGRTVVAMWSTLQVFGVTVDAREIELGATRVFADLTEPFDPTAPVRLGGRGHWLVMPLSSPEPLVGVRLRSNGFTAAQEISVF